MQNYKEFKSFREAATFAKNQAAQGGTSAQLVRTLNSWRVLLPAVAENEEIEHESVVDDTEAERDIEQEELLRDIADDSYDYARSEEDGWFYSDDGGNDSNTAHPGGGLYYDSVYGWFHYNPDELDYDPNE